MNPDLALIVQGLHEATQQLLTSYTNVLLNTHTKLKNLESESHDILLVAELIEREKVNLSKKCKTLETKLNEYVVNTTAAATDLNRTSPTTKYATRSHTSPTTTVPPATHVEQLTEKTKKGNSTERTIDLLRTGLNSYCSL
jgi:hypothetical protein